MTAPPDAVSLFRSVLANPAADTPRLVFADWLEDTGGPHNVAWAEYLRLHTSGQERPVSAEELKKLAALVRAQLTISASTFVRHRCLFLDLLPANNITVRLTGFVSLPSPVDYVPESVVRENQLVPLAVATDEICFATPEPANSDLLAKCEFIFARRVELVRGRGDEIAEWLIGIYGATELVSVDSPSHEYPDTTG